VRPADLLRDLGTRVRALRDARGLTRRELAERARLSERFLAQVETGEGNPSVVSLSQIARALDTTTLDLLAAPARRKPIALLGLRGAGKSTIGRALAKKLRLPFVEIDRSIEKIAGLSLPEIFALHGEDYYRRLEREVLDALFAKGGRFVCAASGGIVTNPAALETLRQNALTIWLKAKPEDHWNRVLAQGDGRPMANDPQAMERMRELLHRREPLYALADRHVDTSELTISEIVDMLAKDTKA
jgi:XRE family aerobic/anaerobic benzoate catabolism transcriptional regulator